MQQADLGPWWRCRIIGGAFHHAYSKMKRLGISRKHVSDL